jgi:hypothetical protein
MAEASDIAVYQKLTEMAEALDRMAADGATLVGEAALLTAARTLHGMASAVYQRIMADRDEGLNS